MLDAGEGRGFRRWTRTGCGTAASHLGPACCPTRVPCSAFRGAGANSRMRTPASLSSSEKEELLSLVDDDPQRTGSGSVKPKRFPYEVRTSELRAVSCRFQDQAGAAAFSQHCLYACSSCCFVDRVRGGGIQCALFISLLPMPHRSCRFLLV